MKGRTKILIFFIILLVLVNIFLYTFDKIVTPTVMTVADSEMRAKTAEVLNNCILDEYSKNFNYDSVIKIEKDEEGDIVLLKADTLKMNKIACDVAVESQRRLESLGNVGIKLPMGYITKNNLLSYLGPQITVKMQPIGHITVKYNSTFESAGINQTRHRIYVEVSTKVRILIPTESNEVEIKNEIPIAETIIVGKVPDTSISLDLKNSGFSLPNGNK